MLQDKKTTVDEFKMAEQPVNQVNFANYFDNKLMQNPDAYKNNDLRSQSELLSADEQYKNSMKELMGKNDYSYREKRQLETENFRNMSALLISDKKWYSFFNSESAEMKRVKESVSYLNNILSQPIEKYFKSGGENVFDSSGLKALIDEAFDDAIKACNEYIDAKNAQGEKTRSTGVRRLRKVRDMLSLCEREKYHYSYLVDAIKSGEIDCDPATVSQKSMLELTTLHLSAVADTTEWQHQGNSTDVYKITVGKETYYIKENLQLISADIEGFLDRRLEQLRVSREHCGDEENEENRMFKAGMKEEDYNACIGLLETMKHELDTKEGAEKERAKASFIEFFSHDFDKMFTELRVNNTAAKLLEEDGGEFDLKKWEDIAKDKNDIMYSAAVYILDAYKEQNKDNKEQKKEKPPIVTKSALDWVTDKLKLSNNKLLGDALKKVYGQKGDKRLEDLFRISLGKEVELFGQMRDRMDGDEREIAAANNTATHVLADKFGFNNLVAGSKTKVVRFKNRAGKMVEAFCTVIEEAKGDEYLDILKNARDKNLKIDYTPHALQQLMQLEAFDRLCMQVDRHGRNFKCDWVKEGDSIVIKSIKSYDHDMSFGEESLKGAFTADKNKDENAPDNQMKMKGYLPNPTLRIKKGSAEYKYIRSKYFGIDFPEYLQNKKETRLNKFQLSQFRGIKTDSLMELVLFNDKYAIMGDYDYVTKKLEGSNKYFGALKDNKGNELDDDAQEAVFDEFKKICQNLFDIVRNKNTTKEDNRRIKRTYSKEESIKLMKEVGRLRRLMDKYDFTGIKTNTGGQGLLQFWMEMFTNTMIERNRLMGDDGATAEDLEVETIKMTAQQKEDIKLLTDPNTGDLIMPAMLHFDQKTYDNICMLADPKQRKDVVTRYKTLNFRKEKIDALIKRAEEMLPMIKEAQKKAEAFFRITGAKGVKAQFFLNEGDYEKFDSIDELSLDPGQTYLSICNDKYLYGKEDFSKMASNSEKRTAYEEEKKKHNDPKLWNDKGYGAGENSNKMTELFNNPLRGKIKKLSEKKAS